MSTMQITDIPELVILLWFYQSGFFDIEIFRNVQKLRGTTFKIGSKKSKAVFYWCFLSDDPRLGWYFDHYYIRDKKSFMRAIQNCS